MGFSAEFLLTAAPDYRAMFNALLELNPQEKVTVDGTIAWAKQTLRKQDRIVWFLRWSRAYLSFFIKSEVFQKYSEESEGMTKFLKNMTSDVERLHGYDIRSMQHNLEHFLSLPIPEIQEYVFRDESPDDLFDIFRDYERQFNENRKHLLLPKEGDRIVLQFPDGWAWWLLPRYSCTEEAQAMGHCGNTAAGEPGQRILSLRQPRKVGTQTWWEPHATFILSAKGYLGEMKGKQNNKPVPRLHPYIVALLKLPEGALDAT